MTAKTDNIHNESYIHTVWTINIWIQNSVMNSALFLKLY